MKSTIVPAQITTVEDKIAGGLGLSQLLLLSMPLFMSGMFYVILPPELHNAAYKLLLGIVLVGAGACLAVRVRGKIVLFWLTLILKYSHRPHYYAFTKNDRYANESDGTATIRALDNKAIENSKTERTSLSLEPIDIADLVVIEAIMARPDPNFVFHVTKHGGLNVSIKEIN